MDASSRAIESLTALAQPTRLAAFRYLLGRPGPVAAGTIAGHCEVPHNTMSTHLATLVRAGLLCVEREGRSMLYSADLEGFRGLVAFLAHDCCNGRPEICAPILSQVPDCTCAPESPNG
jgi:DNA-binding transcriptional ArsR family regulator